MTQGKGLDGRTYTGELRIKEKHFFIISVKDKKSHEVDRNSLIDFQLGGNNERTYSKSRS